MRVWILALAIAAATTTTAQAAPFPPEEDQSVGWFFGLSPEDQLTYVQTVSRSHWPGHWVNTTRCRPGHPEAQSTKELGAWAAVGMAYGAYLQRPDAPSWSIRDRITTRINVTCAAEG